LPPPLSQSERDADWQKLVRTLPRVPAKLAFEAGSGHGSAMRHGTSILTCQFSLSGDTVLVAGGGRLPGCDSSIRVFDLATGEERLVCQGHVCGVYELAVQPGTGFVASASEDYSVVLWNLDKRDAIFVAGGDPIVKGNVAFANARNRLAIGEGEAYEDFVNSAFVIDLDTGIEVFRHKLKDVKEVAAVAISDDGETLYVAVANHQLSPQGAELYCWDLADHRAGNWLSALLGKLFSGDRAVGGRRVWKKTHAEFNVIDLHLLPGTQRLAAAIMEQGDEYRAGVCLLDAQTGDILVKKMQSDTWAQIAIAPDGQTIAVAWGAGGIELVRATDLSPIRMLAEAQAGSFTALQFAPDGKTVVAGVSVHVEDVGPQGEVKVFRIE